MKEVKFDLLMSFPKSFINESGEFIAHIKSNDYFSLRDCENRFDVECKVIEWFTRSAYKGIPYKAEWRNKKFREFMQNGINKFLETEFTEEEFGEIYQKLGNRVRHNLTIDFIESEYNLDVLRAVE